MKIPEGKFLGQQAEKTWEYAAAQIGVEQGIIVEVGREYEKTSLAVSMPGGNTTTWYDTRITRIFFKLNKHEFETLTDLKRALELKAFL